MNLNRIHPVRCYCLKCNNRQKRERNEYNMLTIRIKDVSVVAEDDGDKKEHAKAANRTPMANISTTDLNLFDL